MCVDNQENYEGLCSLDGMGFSDGDDSERLRDRPFTSSCE